MQITDPIVIAAIIPPVPMFPVTFRIIVVISSVAIVIPDTGLLELPTIPTIRADTVTKKNPKITMRIAPPRLTGTAGISHRRTAITAETMRTKFSGRSFVVRVYVSCLFFSAAMDFLNARIIIGNDLIREIMPPQATAPAPM